MRIENLAEPDLFLDAAIEEFEEAQWHQWSKGLCVQKESSVLSYLSEEQGYLMVFDHPITVSICYDRILIHHSDGVLIWDGEEELRECFPASTTHLSVTSISRDDTQKLQYGYWKDYGYSFFDGEKEHRLPLSAEKVQLFPFSSLVYWVFWGKIFLWSPEESYCLQHVDESYDELLPLTDGYLLAVYERKLLVLHGEYPVKRFDNEQILDVALAASSDRIWILLVDGTLLEWNPSETEPVELGVIPQAEQIIGHGVVLTLEGILRFL